MTKGIQAPRLERVREYFLSSSVITRIILHGFPAAITPAGISFVTTLPAPITLSYYSQTDFIQNSLQL
mgnify:CR=1 FL=1